MVSSLLLWQQRAKQTLIWGIGENRNCFAGKEMFLFSPILLINNISLNAQNYSHYVVTMVIWRALPVDSESQLRGNKITLFWKLSLYQAANCVFKKTGLCLKWTITCPCWFDGEVQVPTVARKRLSPSLGFCFGPVAKLCCSWAAWSARWGSSLKIPLYCSGCLALFPPAGWSCCATSSFRSVSNICVPAFFLKVSFHPEKNHMA